MFIGDKGEPSRYISNRRNYDIIIDNERMTLSKLSQRLGFYNIISEGKIKDSEIYYDTERKLLSGAGLLLRKKITPSRTYFSLVRISGMENLENREKKSFLGECLRGDNPQDFPEEIANEINRIFINLFTIDLVEVVKHCVPYIRIDITGNRYKLVSGTGYSAEMTFENLKMKDLRTGKKATKRNFSIDLEDDENYKKEKAEILDVIDTYCKELFYVRRNRFEIAETFVVKPYEVSEEEAAQGVQKERKKKKSRKELEEEFNNQEEKPQEEK